MKKKRFYFHLFSHSSMEKYVSLSMYLSELIFRYEIVKMFFLPYETDISYTSLYVYTTHSSFLSHHIKTIAAVIECVLYMEFAESFFQIDFKLIGNLFFFLIENIDSMWYMVVVVVILRHNFLYSVQSSRGIIVLSPPHCINHLQVIYTPTQS